MRSLLLRLARGSAFYTLANSIEAISPFLVAVIVTRILSPSEYGAWVLFIGLVTFLRPVLNLSLQDALRMRFYDMDERELARFIWSCFCLTTFCASVCVLFLYSIREELSGMLSLPAAWLPAAAVTAYFFANFYFLLAYNQFARQSSHFLVLHVVQTMASISAIAAFVVSGWGWVGIAIGKILGLAIGCCLGVLWLSRELPVRTARREQLDLAHLAKFGLLYLPAGMGLVAIPLTDRVIVTKVLGLAENGFYGVAALFGMALFVAINGILHAWTPWLFRNLALGTAKRQEIALVSVVFLLVLPLGGIAALSLSALIAPVVIGAQFESAFPLIPWAIAGAISMGYFFHVQTFLLYKKAVWEMSASSLLCIIANGVLSYYGARYAGLAGVFAATVGAFLASTMLSGMLALVRYRRTPFIVEGNRSESNL
ncbi:lipopolysaccharide biosynthesis protein [Thioalkalivibrio sp. XN8]|uniref:lipopolysaccharide biosynthesis protein n=1 Tax=Thioalkalivibrio sp. XN8 TaxID=2712863 RepID=UPI0013ED0D35|nr:lipopolysaccharide biosynthesis protein [Thioalkalivibrio sp. XN8]NGP52160.1 lipopolysaccharide biosynthesis protein [Thioalkalivibrio sp. XN8]